METEIQIGTETDQSIPMKTVSLYDKNTSELSMTLICFLHYGSTEHYILDRVSTHFILKCSHKCASSPSNIV